MLSFTPSKTVRFAKRFLSGSVIPANKRIVVVGGVAGGATAAARAMRLDQALNVTIVERSPDVSFANCGLPYYIGREIVDRSKLSLQTPESLSKQLGIKVLTNSTVTSINRNEKSVEVLTTSGEKLSLPYDQLILSPGASPLRPPVEGIDDERIMTLRNLQDMDKIDTFVRNNNINKIVVLGGGFIGLEMVEQLRRIGKEVHLVEKSTTVLPQADEEISEFLAAPIIEAGVQLTVGDGVKSFESVEKSINVVLESGKKVNADLVILSIGVKPDSGLAIQADLATNDKQYIKVNEFMQTSDPAIYAVGDAVETSDLVFPEKKVSVALGNIANMQARIAVDHIVTGKSIPYKGSLGTSIVRVFDHVVAVTGWNEKRLKLANIPYQAVTITDNNHAGYYPGATQVSLKVLFDPKSGRLLGGQAYGTEGVDKRIDSIAIAISNRMSVDDLSQIQFCYSPPFGSARDVTNVAGLAARNIREGFVTPVYSLTNLPKGSKIIDVRPEEMAKLTPIANSINIPYKDIREKIALLDPSVHYVTVCNLGKTSYFSSRLLSQFGFKVSSLVGGLKIHRKPAPCIPTSPTGSRPVADSSPRSFIHLDCTGMSCPGPLLKLKEAVTVMPLNATLHVSATDPGFKADVQAFASASGLKVTSLKTEKGIIHADLQKCEIQENQATSTGSANSVINGNRKGATIVLFSQDYDKAIGAFIIANGAKAMGGEVTIFCTFWGLNALRHPNRSAAKPKTFIDNMFGWMMPKGIDRLPLSNMNFMGAGSVLLKDVMKTKNLPNLEGLVKSAKEQNIRIVACTMSMDAMGITAEELIDGVEFGGVAEYLKAAESTGTNLFI